jgi:DNA-binding GntR family transcriptional regulator
MQTHQDWSSSLADRVFKLLEAAIKCGDMKPGDRVHDHRLAAEFGVSRSPVREALKRLEHYGLIRVLPRRGTYVAQLLSRAETSDLLEIREALEGIAARHAAQRLTATPVLVMRAQLEATVERVNAGEEFGYALDFHEWVLRGSGNQGLQPLLRTIHGQVRLMRFRSIVTSERAKQALRDHLDILEAIRDRNPVLAETRMRAHIRTSRENILRRCVAALQ